MCRLQGSSDRVARVWHTIGTHLAQGDQADALEDLINLFRFIDLEWSHPPGSNRRPADYEEYSPSPNSPLAPYGSA
jgi:hypothetical protein